MKKYYKLSYEDATFYEYTDVTKTKVRKSLVSSDDANESFKHIYFIKDDITAIEPITKTQFEFSNELILRDKTVNLGHTQLYNSSFEQISLEEGEAYFRILQEANVLQDYKELVNKLLVVSPLCYKLLCDKQIKVDRKSLRNKNNKNSFNLFSQDRLYELERQKILLTMCKMGRKI